MTLAEVQARARCPRCPGRMPVIVLMKGGYQDRPLPTAEARRLWLIDLLLDLGMTPAPGVCTPTAEAVTLAIIWPTLQRIKSPLTITCRRCGNRQVWSRERRSSTLAAIPSPTRSGPSCGAVVVARAVATDGSTPTRRYRSTFG